MSNLIITCHVEPLRKKEDITYLDKFFLDIGTFDFPIIYLLMHGEKAGDRILSRFNKNKAFGLHVHGDTREALATYKKYFGQYPRDISYGHWNLNTEGLKFAAKCGVRNDYSYTAYRNKEHYFFKEPYMLNGIREYPSTCDPTVPLSPIVYWKHLILFLMMLPVVKINKQLVMHFSFHSYDLHADFLSKLRWQIVKLYINVLK